MDTNEARTIAEALLQEHGLSKQGWTVQWDRAKNRLGVCRFNTRVIGLSLPLTEVNDEDEVRDTILHEIAHALAGPGAKHGPQWRAVASRIGARPRATSAEAKGVDAKWVGSCPNCDYKINRHRLSEKVRRHACPRCCRRHNNGRWSAQFIFQWAHSERLVSPAGGQ